jgi:hypothetical protein
MKINVYICIEYSTKKPYSVYGVNLDAGQI